MRNPNNAFHLAIPCRDLDETKDYYVEKMGCKLARSYNDRITLNFFGDQVVIHEAPNEIDLEPKMYPRHFGITFLDKNDFDQIHKRAIEKELNFFEELKIRFKGLREEHLTFFLIDPSNNLIEFKYYHDPDMMY
jgi:extradiol dioxygenase family protein